MDMVINTAQHSLNDGRQQMIKPKNGSSRILTHYIEGFIIQESNFPFTSGDEEPEVIQNGGMDDFNGMMDMEMFDADSHSSNDENLNDVFMDEPTVGHCEQCGRVTEIHQYRGPRRFCSTSCARRYSVSCSRKMIAFRERMKGRGRHHSTSHIQHITTPSHRKSAYPSSLVYDQQPPMVDVAIQVSDLDAINNMSFDWSRNDVEPLWIYENVEAAKWSVQQVAEFIRSLTGCSEYADAFVGQEIDGQALMLLREEHMVVAMNMKLGPALKIISKVTQLKRASMKDR